MRLFILRADSNRYQGLVFQSSGNYNMLNQFDGRILSDTWRSPVVEILHNDELGQDLLPSDFPSFATHVPVFSSRAVGALRGLLEENGEILPLSCDEGEYIAFNVTEIVDALHEPTSTIKRFQSSGRIMDVLTHNFLIDRLYGAIIFKIPQVPLMNVYVTDRFRDIVTASDLQGFRFDQVWEFRD